MHKLLLSLLLTALTTLTLSAQEQQLIVHCKDGSRMNVELSLVDSITIGTPATLPQAEATLPGRWLWASAEQGYYELLTLLPDHTYTGFDFYMDYGFSTTAYGTYSLLGSLLTLRSYGYGLTRTYRWFVTALTPTALEVMTQMGRYAYHRVQPARITVRAGGEPYTPAEGDVLLFADGQVAAITDGRLYGLKPGTTYVLMHSAALGETVGFEVVVQ